MSQPHDPEVPATADELALRARRRFLQGVAQAGMAGAAAATTAGAAHAAVTPRGPLGAEEINNIEVFRKAGPSVVHITTLELQRDFFSMNVQQVPRGTGTGFVWDDRGHIVTNFHVIQGGSAARVTLSDQSTHKATLVGAFPDRDLAVLKIEIPREKQAQFPPIAIGSSRDLIVGQRAGREHLGPVSPCPRGDQTAGGVVAMQP